jgi:3-isopropylmalate/(R)-2-methylmalate dehydratase small subunit
MEKFTTLTGIAAPLPMINVDTDMIIPKAHCKSVLRTGFGPHLFHDIRYFDDGTERPDFVLNRPPWRDAAILIAGRNFGCGSSREAAVWAIREFGIRCLVAPGFADIFANNCFQNGVLPVCLPEARVDRLLALARDTASPVMTVDLEARRLTAPDGGRITFVIDSYRRDCLLNGLDEIGATLTHETGISAHERWIDTQQSWRRPAQDRA